MLGEIMNEIRFLAMKPEEFASTPALSGILTQEESFAILMNLTNPDSLPMPIHLPSCRDQRSACLFHRENGVQSMLNDGFYCLRNIDNMALTLTEPFINKVTSFAVNRAVIFKGVIFAGMFAAEY